MFYSYNICRNDKFSIRRLKNNSDFMTIVYFPENAKVNLNSYFISREIKNLLCCHENICPRGSKTNLKKIGQLP